MKDKNISAEKYSTILHYVWIAVVVVIVLIFAGGTYALTKIFHLPWWAGIALFLLFLVIWLRKPKGI